MLVGKLKKTKAVRQVHQRSRATWTRRGNVLLKDEGHSLALEERTTWRCVRWSPGMFELGFDSTIRSRSTDLHDLYRVAVPSILIGTLMVLVDIYATPWFSEIWWVFHPGH